MQSWKYAGALAVLALAAAGCRDGSENPVAVPAAPLAAATPVGPDIIPDEYIVVFHRSEADAPGLARRMTAAPGAELRHVYTAALRGFAARLPAAAVEALRHDPRVAYVEPNERVHAYGTQLSPPWGLDRIDQLSSSRNGQYVYRQTGAGVTVYVIDTGIRTSHVDFGGRASVGYDAKGGNGQDCAGHGTHVAGTVGGNTYGVAKGVTLVAVRVLDCAGEGSTGDVIAGVDWVTSHRVLPAVANMSLGMKTNWISPQHALDDAVKASINAGVVYVVAAGNDNADACSNYTPARVVEALTVGATTTADARSSYSNYGSCVDLWAPGDYIPSAWYTSNTATNQLSGTSMAAPHVAGVAALALEERPTATPRQVQAAIWNASPSYVVSNISQPGYLQQRKLVYSPHVYAEMHGPSIDFFLYPGYEGTYTWSVDAWGRAIGTALSYVWKISWDEGVSWTVVGYDPTYTQYVGPNDNFRILVEVGYGFTTQTLWAELNHDGDPYHDGDPGGCDNVYTIC